MARAKTEPVVNATGQTIHVPDYGLLAPDTDPVRLSRNADVDFLLEAGALRPVERETPASDAGPNTDPPTEA